MKVLKAGDTRFFMYRNHRGELAQRNVLIIGVDYGENEWYPIPGWFLRCWDLDKRAMRSFRFENIVGEPW